ncbi:MAG: pyruvate dehydrogenase (acetyl-transferring) E1 component subunit alpha [Bacillati bacterium ANGP1]|uniref:Pyruvate dehydrogenase (Acetyl-transferring) E1 component subunit alpha n=1 Tax=Candidatus Segetimicrobium genomatis TaxID=2569760 RepID=A0A537J0B3_9BACT|nr:MAG: pyruvate dehydrogenase (acetyl-transferring) E1 component subunit alpha [Terrabacteria group bacterium ANGP1]
MDTRSVKTAPPRDLGRDELAAAVEWYGKMVLVRRFEEEAEREFRRGKIGGYLHVYSGQEAVAAGFLSAIRPDDIFFTAYRDHAHALFRGAAPGAVMAELFGKATGLAKGKGGSMHLFDVARGFYGGYGIVGGHIPLATGAAFALRYQQADRICLCFLGDGAMNSGSFHEPANLAGLWGKQGLCPIVYIVENNQYAMGTPVDRSSAVTNLASRFSTYGIENERADGMDFIEVRRLAGRAVRRVRETGRPYAVELLTYRFAGHGAADLFQPYRTKDEIAQARQRDPITLLEDLLRATGALSDGEVKRARADAERVVTDAVRFAEESPPPAPEELYRDIYGADG